MGVQMEPYPELSDSFSRDCLESRRRVLDRLCVVLQEDEMGHFRPLLATRYTPNRGLLGLSRQSLRDCLKKAKGSLDHGSLRAQNDQTRPSGFALGGSQY